MPEFGDVMAELRQDAGLTQKELAEKLYMAKSSISNLETGQRRAHAELICKIADFFDVSTDYLLGRSNFSQSFSITADEYSSGKTIGDLLALLLTLDAERRKILCALINDMSESSAKHNP